MSLDQKKIIGNLSVNTDDGREPKQFSYEQEYLIADAVSNIVGVHFGVSSVDEFLRCSAAKRLDAIDLTKTVIGKSLLELSRTQYDRIGDGSGTVVILCAAFIKAALRLWQQNGESSLDAILKGFYAVNQEACKHTKHVLAITQSTGTAADFSVLKNVAKTVLQSKLLQEDADIFSALVGDIWQRNVVNSAVQPVAVAATATTTVTDAFVKLIVINGLPTNQSKMLEGYTIRCDSAIVCAEVPVQNQKLKLVCCNCNVKKLVAPFNQDCVTDDDQHLDSVLSDWEAKETTKCIEKIQFEGVNIVFCSGKVDAFCREAFSNAGIHVFEGVNRSELQQVAHLTGASQLLSTIVLFGRKYVGTASGFNYQCIDGNHLVSVMKTPNINAYSIVIHAIENEYGLAIKDAVKSSLRQMKSVYEKGVVVGGGMFENQLASHLKGYALKFAKDNVLLSDIANAYSSSLLSIPQKLKANGLDVATAVAAADNDDCGGGEGSNIQNSSILDAMNVKTTALTFATNTVVKCLNSLNNQASPSNKNIDGQNHIPDSKLQKSSPPALAPPSPSPSIGAGIARRLGLQLRSPSRFEKTSTKTTTLPTDESAPSPAKQKKPNEGAAAKVPVESIIGPKSTTSTSIDQLQKTPSRRKEGTPSLDLRLRSPSRFGLT